MTHPTPIRTAGYRTALPPRAGTCAFLLSAVLLSAVLIPACSGDIPGSDSAAVPVLELVEELRLGVLEGADEEMFAFVSDVLELDDGSIVVLDSRAPALRHFSEAGEVLGTIGRSGEGPGEYTRPSGLALVPGEGFALWDAGNARISFFAPDGEFRSSVHVPLGLSSPLFRDAQGRFHIRSFVIPAGWQPSPGTASPPLGWIRLSREGAIQDTIPIPEEWPDGMGFIIQTPDGSLFPFQRRTLFALTPEGTPVHSTNESYRVVRGSPETPGETVIERRAHVPVPIEGEERAQYEAWARYVVRENPESRLAVIPPTKPAILDLRVGDEGRFWVRPHRPGTRIPPPSTAPEPGGPPRIEFREIPPRYDLFSPEGAFLGEVEFPRGAQILRAAGNRVWVRTPGDVGEPQVVRYRVEARAGGEEPPRVASEPELSIGAVDGAAPIVFQQIRGAVQLSDGRIVVADGGSQEVRYFSASGSHVMTTGGPGDGPGEFRRLSGLTRLPGDSVWAHDGGALRFTILDPEGRVAAMGSTGTAPTVIGRMADGSRSAASHPSPSLPRSPGSQHTPEVHRGHDRTARDRRDSGRREAFPVIRSRVPPRGSAGPL